MIATLTTEPKKEAETMDHHHRLFPRRGRVRAAAKRGHKLSYSNVMSTLAVFLLLCQGTAYASHLLVRSSDVVDESLMQVDLATGSVSGSEVAFDSVGGEDITNSSLSGSDVQDNSLSSLDLGTNSVRYDELAPNAVGSTHQIANGVIGSWDVRADFLAPNADRVDGRDSSTFQDRVLWALVAPDGRLMRGFGPVTTSRTGPGRYEISFGRDVSACSPVVNIPYNFRGMGQARTDGGNFVEVTTHGYQPVDGAFRDTKGVAHYMWEFKPQDLFFYVNLIC